VCGYSGCGDLRPKIELLTFTTLYPNASQPAHGVFVENRLRHLAANVEVNPRVVAPVPWFPWTSSRFGYLSRYAKVPDSENRSGIDIVHPRYVVIPRIGMLFAPLLLFLGSILAVKAASQARDFDLIDAHYFYPDGVAAVLLGWLFRKPVVITARGTDVNLIPNFRLPRAMIRAAARRASAIIAVSQALKDAIVDLGVPPQAVTVLRNGVDLRAFHPGGRESARSELGLAGSVLLSVGHLIERKGHEFAIGALVRLKQHTLLIAGEGPERPTLEALASKLGVAARVRFLGSVPHHDLQKIYVAADVLVLASSREGWPNVLLEAMACGTPVVATAIWGNPEVVSCPQAGLLMKSRTADGAADAVEELSRMRPNRDATRAYAEQFSWDATSAGQQELFEQILSARRN
jgi:teichuronic acid biosynthesis glycosyltransferase TuaC